MRAVAIYSLIICFSAVGLYAGPKGFYPLLKESGWSQTTVAPGTTVSTENLDSGDGTQIVYSGMEGLLGLLDASFDNDFPLTRTQQD